MTKGDWIRDSQTKKPEKLNRTVSSFNWSGEEGIPLTRDLLIQIGFKNENPNEGYLLKWGNGFNIVLWYRPKFNNWACMFWNPKNLANPEVPSCSDIEFLHQLQRIYRSSGEELLIDSQSLTG